MTKEEAKTEIEKVFEPAFANYIIKALTDGATESDMPCEDAISRETLLKYAVYVELANGNKGWVIEKGYVEDLPSVKVEPQTAEWIVNKDLNGRIQCSACGMFLGLTEEDLKEGYLLSKYCSNCGAKMKGEKNERIY